MYYVEFRRRVLDIIDEYNELADDPICDSPRIDLEDKIDLLLKDVVDSTTQDVALKKQHTPMHKEI